MSDIDDIYAWNSVVIAKYIVALANDRRISINITKVQKLLYIAYGVYLAVKSQRLTDEHPQAWPYGPVFPTTKNKLSKLNIDEISLADETLDLIKQDNEINSMLDLVLNTYGRWTAKDLTIWSHQEGSPWEKTVGSNNFKWGDRISDEVIKKYFDSKIQRD